MVLGMVGFPAPAQRRTCASFCATRRVAGLERHGELEVLLRVLVAAVDAASRPASGRADRATHHLRGVTLEQATAAAGEERVAGEDGRSSGKWYATWPLVCAGMKMTRAASPPT